jgi:CPA2 family monovalent cation:H+ antiporter-2
MSHDTSLITTIVVGLVLAYILGALANRLRLPPLVGYLLAGVLVGPNTPGLVLDRTLAPQLAELGVILLMFGVGLHFSLKDLLSVRAVVIPGVLVEIIVIPLLGLGLSQLMGWPIAGGLVFGLSLSVASTVVLLKTLQDRHLTDSDRGRVAIGWLIVEDMTMVVALVLIPALSGLSQQASAETTADPFVSFVERLLGHPVGIYWVVAITILKLAAFVGFMLVVGRRIIPQILHWTAHTGSRELFRLAVLAIALGVAAGAAYLFGVSLALGAFFAGMILSERELSHRAAEETLPLRDAFAVLFFVSVGMLLKVQVFIDHPLAVLGVLAIILIGKSALAMTITLLFRQPLATALTLGAAIAQIGEFSFILIGLGVELGLVPALGQDLIVAGALISMLANPLLFLAAEKLRPAIEAQIRARRPITADLGPQIRTEPNLEESRLAQPEPAAPALAEEPAVSRVNLRNHIVLAGFGRVGTVVAQGLAKSGAEFVVVEDGEGRAAAAREKGYTVIAGNTADPDIMRLANVESARCLLIAIPNAFEAGQATEQGRKLNDGLRIVARSHSDEEEDYLRGLGADIVISGEREIGLGMLALMRGEQRDDEARAEAAAMGREAQAVPEAAPVPEPVESDVALDPMHEDEPIASLEPAAPDLAADEAAVPTDAEMAFADEDDETTRIVSPPLLKVVSNPIKEAQAEEAAVASAVEGTSEASAVAEAEEEVASAPEPAAAAAPAEVADEPVRKEPVSRPEPVIVLPEETGPDLATLKDVSPVKTGPREDR